MLRTTVRTAAGWLAIAMLAAPGVALSEEKGDCERREERVASAEVGQDAKSSQTKLEIPIYVPPASRGSVPGRVGGGSRGGKG